MKKKSLFLVVLLVGALGVACSSDDNKPVIEPSIDLKKDIQKKWEFTTIQTLDKDKKVLKDYLSAGQYECKNNIWEFNLESRIDLMYHKDPDLNTCDEYKKTVPYSLKDKELVTIIVNDGDQLVPAFFEIREMTKDKMVLFVKNNEYTEEEAISSNLPKETRFIQYVLKAVK
ncbi:hypothetical protein LNQ81_11225 [Myroides sp. M-43]|uniref:hypothetical protein n=1 Tax=Myroides oncorhynchi TaxID=2893756 RepID=UPI001E487A53|nr:hypothetical protein [Myroides oncorhynchi]MCC9043241.1 hypothetical protein [Myroides oncorhynchi]